MTHLAPKQGLFALIIFISFCLHILAFTVVATNQQNAQNITHAQAVSKQISQELELPLSIREPTSISVIASRYANDPAIAYIGVYDQQNRLLAPVGDNDSTSEPITHTINVNGMTVGALMIKPTEINRASLLGNYLPLVILIGILHALVWFCYGYIARPDKDYYEQIYGEARKKLIASGIPIADDDKNKKPVPRPEPITAESLSARMQETEPTAKSASNTTNTTNDQDKKLRFGSIFDKLKTKNDQDTSTVFGRSTPQNALPNGEFSYYSNEKMGDNLYVYISFLDPNNLLTLLEDAPRATYLTLCNQLLHKTINKVLSRPILSGVRLDGIHDFSHQNGKWVACVHLSRHNNYARLALAGAMISKLLPAIHQVVYARHRELGQFALPMKAIACDDTRREPALLLLQKRDEQSLLLLSHDDINSILTQFNVARHKEANALYEKECRIITTAQNEMLKQLTTLRDTVLLQD